jgi:hypothetical protein
MQSAFINSRADLDAAKGTPAYDQFMEALGNSIFRLEKDDDAKVWKVVDDTSMIERFGFSRAEFASATPPDAPIYIVPEVEKPDPKMVGIEFDGVMCSATRDDQNGILAVVMAYTLQKEKFQATEFLFVNGTRLKLSLSNIQQFLAVWMPFRQSFFKPE